MCLKWTSINVDVAIERRHYDSFWGKFEWTMDFCQKNRIRFIWVERMRRVFFVLRNGSYCEWHEHEGMQHAMGTRVACFSAKWLASIEPLKTIFDWTHKLWTFFLNFLFLILGFLDENGKISKNSEKNMP